MKMNPAKIGEKQGYSIFYDPERKLFCLRDAEDNEVASASTQEKVEEQIPEITKQAFKLPIPAILSRHSSVEKGRITSLNLHQETVYFSYDDKSHGRTEKVSLRYDKSIFELTGANEKVVSQIEERVAHRKKLDDEIETLKKQFEKPIDTKYFGTGLET